MSIWVCRDEDIAVAVACPVVAKYEAWNQIVIYGGCPPFQGIPGGQKGRKYTATRPRGLWGPAERKAPLLSLSQEHGMIEMNDTFLREVRVGDLLVILPVHSCLTADLYRSYLTLDGKKIERRQSNDPG
jgi:D-serine deaminase-like pyridoxal phosphate-dependent protein